MATVPWGATAQSNRPMRTTPRFLFRIPSKTRFSTQIMLKLAAGLVLCGEDSAQTIAILLPYFTKAAVNVPT